MHNHALSITTQWQVWATSLLSQIRQLYYALVAKEVVTESIDSRQKGKKVQTEVVRNKERAWIVGDVVKLSATYCIGKKKGNRTSTTRQLKNMRTHRIDGASLLSGWHFEIYKIGVTLPIPLPLDKLGGDITPERRTSAAAPKAMGGIVCRN